MIDLLRLYRIVKKEIHLSDNLCGECMKNELVESPMTPDENLEEVTPSWEEGYICAHCGVNYSEWYEKESQLED